MRYHLPLNDVLGSKIKLNLLRALSRTESDHTGRELARLIGYSHNATRSALEDLERSGLVIQRQAGRANLYSIDQDNIIYTDILTYAFRIEDELLDRIAEIVSKQAGRELSSLILFGSVARGDEDPGSDIDMVVVFKDGTDLREKEDSVHDAAVEIVRRFGNQLSPILVTESEFEKKKKSKTRLWQDIGQTGIPLKPNKELSPRQENRPRSGSTRARPLCSGGERSSAM